MQWSFCADVGSCEYGRCDIQTTYEFIIDLAGFDVPGPANEQGYMKARVVEKLLASNMAAAVVSANDDHR